MGTRNQFGGDEKLSVIERFERVDKILADAETLHERLKLLTADIVDDQRTLFTDNASLSDKASYVATAKSISSDNDENCCPVAIDELIKPTLRPIFTMKPGMPAFRHDPVKRFELYQKEWSKYPIPGEDKRLPLRWKVREYMLRQDAPAKMLNL